MVFFQRNVFFQFFSLRVFLQQNLITNQGFFRKRGSKIFRKKCFFEVVVSYTREGFSVKEEVFLLKRRFSLKSGVDSEK